jgi:hypothetical protein
MPLNEVRQSLRDANLVWSRALSEADETAIILRLKPKLSLQQDVSGAVGSGKAGLRHKMHCVCSRARLMSPSWAAAARRVSNTFSWTGDRGTERGIGRFYDNIKLLIGPWVVADDASRLGADRDNSDDDESDAGGGGDVDRLPAFDFRPEGHGERVEPAPVLADPYVVDCRASLFVMGLLHIVHNLTESFNLVLLFWDTFIEQLTHTTRLISKRHSKQRLLRSCFNRMPQKAFAHLIEKFNFAVYTKRWGTVMAAVMALLPLREALVSGWDLDLYLGVGGVADVVPGDIHNAKANIVNEGICSNLFWAYMVMLDILADALLELCGWSEGCPCHENELRTLGHNRHARARHFRAKYNASGCIFRGMRAAEMAAGALLDKLRILLELANSVLLLAPTVATLSPVDKAIVLRDFAAARRHVTFTLTMKLGYWGQLPHVLAGLGHLDLDIARECGRRALDLATRILDWSEEHSITKAWGGDHIYYRRHIPIV